MSEKRVVYINILNNYYQLRETDDNKYCCEILDPAEISDLLNEQQDTIERLNRRLDYETRMHKKWKDDCLAILEEQDLNDYVKELKKGKKSGWDSEPNTDYITRAKEGLK